MSDLKILGVLPQHKRTLSNNPASVRSRLAWAENREERNIYHADYNKRRKAENPEYLEKRRASARRSAKNRRVKIKAFLVAIRDVPCCVCGIVLPPEVMDFDHIWGEKAFDIAHWNRGTYRSIDCVIREIAKCRVICPNCHRLRHHEERVAAADGRHLWTDGYISEVSLRCVDIATALQRFNSMNGGE